ncbi:MAG: S-layer homology domain-containing protein [Sedimentibacter sp.]
MIKRRLSLILATVMILTLSVPNAVFGSDYTEHWAKETIQEWFDNGRIKGYEDGSFKPDNSITRAEFMTMVNSAYDFEELAEINFSDAVQEEWYYAEVQKAVGAGYIVGDNDDTVRPQDEITRQEVAVVISRLNSLEQNSDVTKFEDEAEIADWAVGFVGAVAEAGYMIGDDNKNFNPSNDITRAEALVTLDRAMKDKVEYAAITELSIEGAQLEKTFNSEITTYSAIAAAGVTEVIIVADVTTNAAINFTSDVTDSTIDVKTASASEDSLVYTATVSLSDSDDTVVTMTVSQEGLEDRVYTITIKEEVIEVVAEE